MHVTFSSGVIFFFHFLLFVTWKINYRRMRTGSRLARQPRFSDVLSTRSLPCNRLARTPRNGDGSRLAPRASRGSSKPQGETTLPDSEAAEALMRPHARPQTFVDSRKLTSHRIFLYKKKKKSWEHLNKYFLDFCKKSCRIYFRALRWFKEIKKEAHEDFTEKVLGLTQKPRVYKLW